MINLQVKLIFESRQQYFNLLQIIYLKIIYLFILIDSLPLL